MTRSLTIINDIGAREDKQKITNMKTMQLAKLLAVLIALASTTTTLVAQDGTNVVELPKQVESPERPDYWPWTVAIGGGSEGFIGGSVVWRFSDHVGARAGVGWTEWSMGETSVAGINYNAKIRLLGEPLTLNVYPWKRHSCYVSFGWFFNQNEMTGTAGEDGTIIIDGHPIAIQPGRSLSMKIQQQPVNPYLAIGGNFLYFDHAQHWALGAELGVIYSGDPKVSLTRSGAPDAAIDAVLNGATARLQKYADQFRFMPAVSVKVTFSF